MEELTEQDIADMKLDKLSPAKFKIIQLDIEGEKFMVKGYPCKNSFEIKSVYIDLGNRWHKTISKKNIRFIQDNYEDKLVEACL